jgi:GNAT superfamily N-acetyltransferase
VIREAEEADIPALVAMAQRFIRESSYEGKIASNADVLTKLMGNLIGSNEGCIFVSEQGSKVTGMIGAYLYVHPFSGENIAGEAFWWVEPEYRGGGVKLMLEVEKWARAKGADRLTMIAPSPKVETLYQALGYGKLETHYQKDL